MADAEQLKAAIVSYMEDYSIEVAPHDRERWPQIAEVLKPGTSVYIAHPPGTALQEVLDFADLIARSGFRPVPHIIARKLESRHQLETALVTLQGLKIDEALVIAGDAAVDNNAFDSSLAVLETGYFEQYGFKAIGISGHPEGSKAIGEQRVREALQGKMAFSRDAAFDLRIVTQFCFDPQAVTDWEQATTAAGVTLPIHLGMAGPASLKQLVRFAMLCGVGASARMLMNRPGATASLLKTQAPDNMILHVARHRLQHPDSRLQKAHFFCFGGVVKTAQWANAVREGRFELNKKGSGFSVSD